MTYEERIAVIPTNDPVMHPAHYSRWKMEAIEFIAINNLCWWLANVIKYCMRYDAKDGLQDLYKARSYLDMQIRLLEGHPRFWEKPVGEERKLNRERDPRQPGEDYRFPDKAVFPGKGPPLGPAPVFNAERQDLVEKCTRGTCDCSSRCQAFGVATIAYANGVEVARYCHCGQKVTDAGACWDDDCEHKKGLKQPSDGELRRRQKDAGE